MANEGKNRADIILSDEPGNRQRVRAILADWGMETAAIRRMMRAHPGDRTTAAGGAPQPVKSDATRGRIMSARPLRAPAIGA